MWISFCAFAFASLFEIPRLSQVRDEQFFILCRFLYIFWFANPQMELFRCLLVLLFFVLMFILLFFFLMFAPSWISCILSIFAIYITI